MQGKGGVVVLHPHLVAALRRPLVFLITLELDYDLIFLNAVPFVVVDVCFAVLFYVLEVEEVGALGCCVLNHKTL